MSKVREILTRRNSTEKLRFWNRSSFAVWGFPKLLTLDLVTFNFTLSIAYRLYDIVSASWLLKSHSLNLPYSRPFYRCMTDPTYNDSGLESWISRSNQNRLKIQIQTSLYVGWSDPFPSDICFKNKMTWTTFKKVKNTHQKAESATRLIRMLHNRCSVLCSSCPSQNLTKSHF